LRPSNKPKTIKKHIPGPYGLVTIEIPIEEEEKRKAAQKATSKRTQSLVRTKQRFSSFDQSIIKPDRSGNRKAMFVEELKEVDELTETEFTPESQQKTPEAATAPEAVVSDTYRNDNDKFSDDQVDDQVVLKDLAPEEIEKVSEKEPEEPRTQKDAEKCKLAEVPPEVSVVEQGVLSNNVSSPNDLDGEFVDHYADAPSTAKSSDTLNLAQSSVTTEETEETELDEKHSSMAQTLRQTIPNGYVNSHDLEPVDDRRSSIYSSESEEVPARSSKRQYLSPKKSALKFKGSTSSISLTRSNSNKNNAASEAYLSLTTAENTRINALNTGTSTLSRSPSRVIKTEKPLNGKAVSEIHHPQPRVSQSQGSNPQPQKARPVSTIESPSKQANTARRPMSTMSTPPVRQQQQPPKAYQKTKSSAGTAALNATRKPDRIPAQPERKSSFEKERPRDSHAAFKRLSLRDPSFSSHPKAVESQMGYYRNQAVRANGVQTLQQQEGYIQQQGEELPQNFSSFRSRFDDSDSDSEFPVVAPAPQFMNGNTLRKPNSSYTLRSASQTTASPAKSVPDYRMTRYFSESEAARSQPKEEKEPKKRFGKLRRLFGRSDK
jgi:hypothetical protein